jgi:hypothetical protein
MAGAADKCLIAIYINAYCSQTLKPRSSQLNEKLTSRVPTQGLQGNKLSSAAGAGMVHEDLQAKGLLKQAPGQGGSCAN